MDDLILADKYLRKARGSKDKNIPFSLTFAQFKKLKSAKTCAYSGLKFSGEHPDPLSLTLDRLDNSKGYTKDNTFAVCHMVNKAKSIVENPQNKLTDGLMVSVFTEIEELKNNG